MAKVQRYAGPPPPLLEIARLPKMRNEFDFSGGVNTVIHRCGLSVHKWKWRGKSCHAAFDYERSVLFAWGTEGLTDEDLQDLAEAFEELAIVPPSWP